MIRELILPPGELVLPAQRRQVLRHEKFDIHRSHRGVWRPQVAGGAVTVPGLFVLTWKDFHDNSDVIMDWVNDDIQYALFDNDLTPNYSTDTAYATAPYDANEITGTGYTAGGADLASKTVSESPTGTLMYDAADPAWTSATFSGARCGLIWDNTLAADLAVALQDFDADFGVTAGTFTVVLASGGVFNIDLTPAA